MAPKPEHKRKIPNPEREVGGALGEALRKEEETAVQHLAW
jgi:hypothetical protein